MKLQIEIHDHRQQQEAPLWAVELLDQGALILERLDNIMVTLADAQAAQAITDQKISAISADVQALLAKISAIPTGGLTPDQQTAIDDIAAHAGRINDALSAVDTSANPAPPAA